MSRQFVAHAPAKVNLALAVGPVQADGLHPIASRMVSVDLYDDLELRELPAGSMPRFATLWHEDALRTSTIDWRFGIDLAARAHRLLEEVTATALPVQSTLRKRIPVGGGLGGGSSDAAAMLHGLNALFDLGLGTPRLAELGGALGADVPFLVHGGHAFVEGTGDRCSPLPMDDELDFVLVFPDVACPTAQIFAAFDHQPPAAFEAERAKTECFNDLAAPVFEAFPDLKRDKEALETLAEGPVYLSGSGSTLFLACTEAIHAQLLATAITETLGLPAVAVQGCSGVAFEQQ